MANPPITIGPFSNVPAPGSPIKSDWPQQISHYVYDTPGVVKKTSDTMSGTLTADRLVALNATDTSLASTAHALQLGATTGLNLAMSRTQLQVRNAGAAGNLYLQPDGGATYTGPLAATGAITASTSVNGDSANFTSVVDTGLTGVGQPLILGPTSGLNMVLSRSRIQVRSGGASGNLYLQPGGGGTNCGGTFSATNLTADTGNVTATNGGVVVPNGNVNVGSTDGQNPGNAVRSDGTQLTYISGATALTSPNVNLCRGGTPAGVGGVYLRFNRGNGDTFGNSAAIGSITIDTGLAAVKYNTTSDYRLKNDHGEITGAVERLQQLIPRRYAWKSAPDIEMDGFFAHEVSPAVPEAVTGSKDAVTGEDHPDREPGQIDPQQLELGRLVPLLVAAVKELADRVATLEAA